jgi:hypothetical protein
MRGTTKELLPGRLMLVAAFLFLIAAALRSEGSGVFVIAMRFL